MEKQELPMDNTTELTVVLSEANPSGESLSFKVLLERFYLFHGSKGQAASTGENTKAISKTPHKD